jgi:hypothetical protein
MAFLTDPLIAPKIHEPKLMPSIERALAETTGSILVVTIARDRGQVGYTVATDSNWVKIRVLT